MANRLKWVRRLLQILNNPNPANPANQLSLMPMPMLRSATQTLVAMHTAQTREHPAQQALRKLVNNPIHNTIQQRVQPPT